MSNSYHYSSGPTPPSQAPYPPQQMQQPPVNSGVTGPAYYPPPGGAAQQQQPYYDQYGQQRQGVGGGNSAPPNRPFSPGGRPLKIYVANVGPQIKSFHLQEKFIQFGNITNIEVKPNLSCAFIEFVDADSTVRAVAGGDGTELLGNILRVEAQKPRRQRTRDPYGMRGPRMGRYLPYPDDYRRRHDMYGQRPYDYPPTGYMPDPYYQPYGRPPAPYPARPPYPAAPMGGAPAGGIPPAGTQTQGGYGYGQSAPSSNEYQPQAPYVSQQMPYQQPDFTQLQTAPGTYDTAAVGTSAASENATATGASEMAGAAGIAGAYEAGATEGDQVGQPLISGGTTDAGLTTEQVAPSGALSESVNTSESASTENAEQAHDEAESEDDEDESDDQDNSNEQPEKAHEAHDQDSSSEDNAEEQEEDANPEKSVIEITAEAPELGHPTENEESAPAPPQPKPKPRTRSGKN